MLQKCIFCVNPLRTEVCSAQTSLPSLSVSYSLDRCVEYKKKKVDKFIQASPWKQDSTIKKEVEHTLPLLIVHA